MELDDELSKINKLMTMAIQLIPGCNTKEKSLSDLKGIFLL
jgi:hypothetical protein